MILPKDVPFEKRARFMLDSLSAYPDTAEFADELGKHAIDIDGGLKAHYELMKGMYADAGWVEGKDDDARYGELLSTMAFLYAVFAFGELVREHGQYSVVIDKAILKQQYRKGGFSRRKQHVERHGFSLTYLAGQNESMSLSRASHLSMAYDHHPTLVPAAKHFAESIEAIAEGPTKLIYNKLGMFLKGDFGAAILQEPIPRDGLDPLGEDVLRPLGEYRQQWVNLVSGFRDQCGMGCSGFWTYGGTSLWGISFAAKRKRPLAIFTLGSDSVFIEFTLPVGDAEAIIRDRHNYSDTIRERIESLHCVRCPKECKGSNMTKVDGVSLCTGRAEARRIYTTLSSCKDFESIHSMIDIVC